MPVDIHAPFPERVQQALADPHLHTAIHRAMERMAVARTRALAATDAATMRAQMRRMKAHVLRHLPEYLETLERNLEDNGAVVHWARDAQEARTLIREIALQNGAQTVVKSKSMVTEEIHLNEALEEAGIRVVETDLGEYIIQLAGEPPSHIVAPVIHRRLEDISQVFQEKLGAGPTYDPGEMTSIARAQLRKDFFQADMGISGVNFAIAETGTVCIVTNEGNGRMVTSLPPVYVAVMGIEKIVPTVEDAFLQLQALCRSATGQAFSVYFSMTSGPRSPEHPDGPEQFHVVLLDNGRIRMLERGYGEALMCVRCGACLNVCPVYAQIGGHAYGSTYSGPIGAVITPAMAPDLRELRDLPHASSLCGACREACPVQIDLPRLLLDLRADLAHLGAEPRSEAWGIRAFVETMRSRARYERAGKLARLTTGLLARFSGGNLRFMPPPLNGWTQYRDFPPFAPKSFREWWQEREELRGRETG